MRCRVPKGARRTPGRLNEDSRINRLDDIAVKARRHCSAAIFWLAIARERHETDSVSVLAQPPRHLIPVECGQTDVDQGNVRLERQCGIDGAEAISRFVHLVPQKSQWAFASWESLSPP